MCGTNMTQLLFLIYVVLNICTQATEKNKIDEEPSQNRYSQAIENLNLPDECMVCYENFPAASVQLPCGHELCALCTQSILQVCVYKNCPKCRGPLPVDIMDLMTMTINIYPIHLTDPNISMEKLQHAFPLICSVASLETVTKCIDMGIDVNKKGFFGYFPIHLASQTNVLKYLIDKGADVNQLGDDGVTPLCINSTKGDLPSVKFLIENGADVNQAGFEGGTPLYMSSQEGHLQVMKYLIDKGANVNQISHRGATALVISSERNNLPIVQYLVESGADLNLADNEGVTPLAVAIDWNQLEVAKFLIKNNANIKITKLFFKKNNYSDLVDILDKLCTEIEEQSGENKFKAEKAKVITCPTLCCNQ